MFAGTIPGKEPHGTGGNSERRRQGFQTPLLRAGCRGSRVVSPLLPQPENKVSVSPHPFPPSSALLPKGPLPTLSWNGEAGRGKPRKPETWRWGVGRVDISRACGQDQMRSCVFLSRSSPRTWGQRWVGGWDLSLSIVAGDPQENLEAMTHLTERNAEAWGWTG